MHFLRENSLIVLIWVTAICISITAYIGMQNIFPSYWDVFLGHTIYALVGMPNAFMHMIGIYVDNSAHHDFVFFAVAAAYWTALGAAHYWYAQEREGKYVAVIAFFVFTSSVKWLYFSVALIHGSVF